eukprot:GILJ01003004.1.p1 GENE.GILJ01003004.1~~GILJ01003004.1.p1  ORF type:complete len:691 (-),score=107.59 GILJ01003004.1:290-2311(-)
MATSIPLPAVGKRKLPTSITMDEANRHNVPAFLTKTFDILEDPSYENVISWNQEGDAFVVKNPNDFSERVLPKFFKHNNFASFVRQLNMYDFHKTRQENNANEFRHPLFRRGQRHLLKDIKRKTPDASPVPAPSQSQFDFGKSRKETDALLHEVMNLSHKHQELEAKLAALEEENRAYTAQNQSLWTELYNSRERQKKMQDKVQRILYFLVSFLQMNGSKQKKITMGNNGGRAGAPLSITERGGNPMLSGDTPPPPNSGGEHNQNVRNIHRDVQKWIKFLTEDSPNASGSGMPDIVASGPRGSPPVVQSMGGPSSAQALGNMRQPAHPAAGGGGGGGGGQNRITSGNWGTGGVLINSNPHQQQQPSPQQYDMAGNVMYPSSSANPTPLVQTPPTPNQDSASPMMNRTGNKRQRMSGEHEYASPASSMSSPASGHPMGQQYAHPQQAFQQQQQHQQQQHHQQQQQYNAHQQQYNSPQQHQYHQQQPPYSAPRQPGMMGPPQPPSSYGQYAPMPSGYGYPGGGHNNRSTAPPVPSYRPQESSGGVYVSSHTVHSDLNNEYSGFPMTAMSPGPPPTHVHSPSMDQYGEQPSPGTHYAMAHQNIDLMQNSLQQQQDSVLERLGELEMQFPETGSPSQNPFMLDELESFLSTSAPSPQVPLQAHTPNSTYSGVPDPSS